MHFAADTLIFCEATQDQMLYLCWILMWFEALSSLNINLKKSELIPMGKIVDVENLIDELFCEVGCLPSTYLGMPLGQGFSW